VPSLPGKRDRLDRLRSRIMQKWREYFRRAAIDVPIVVEDPPTEPTEPTEIKPRPGDSGTTYLSWGGTRIPEECIDGSSTTYLIKPESGDHGERGLCVLLPWLWVDFVERAEILTEHKSYELTNTTRNYDLPNSRKYPNGARVHLRTPIGGGEIGTGTLRVKGRDGAWHAWHGDFARRKHNWSMHPEGPAPANVATATRPNAINAAAEEINDIVYSEHQIYLPESWDVYSTILFTWPLEGAHVLNRVIARPPPLLLYEIPEIAWGLDRVIAQFQSGFGHVSYEAAFSPRAAFTGSQPGLVIYTPIGEFPRQTHDATKFSEISPGKWVMVI